MEEHIMAVKPIPEGYHSVTPYLIVQDGAGAIEFYKRAFGATELMRMNGPDGKPMPRSGSATRRSCWPTSFRAWEG
jgi:hypothetical protein